MLITDLSWEAVLSSIIFNIFINDLDVQVKVVFLKSVDDTQLGGIVTQKVINKIQNNFDKLNK